MYRVAQVPTSPDKQVSFANRVKVREYGGKKKKRVGTSSTSALSQKKPSIASSKKLAMSANKPSQKKGLSLTSNPLQYDA